MQYEDLMGIWKSLQGLEKGRPESHYSRLVVDFSQTRNQGTNVVLKVYGDYISKGSYTGDVGDCTLRISSKNVSEIPLTEFKKSKGVFSTLYLSSTDTSGTFVFYVGGAWNGEIETSTGDKVGLLNASGVDINPTTEETLEEVKTAVESLDLNAFDASTDTIKQGFGGNVFNMVVTAAMVTDDAKHAFAATTKKLRDVLIKNTHATESLIIGENQADVATMRTADFELAAGEAIGFSMVDLNTLYYCTKVNTEEPTASLIGVEE